MTPTSTNKYVKTNTLLAAIHPAMYGPTKAPTSITAAGRAATLPGTARFSGSGIKHKPHLYTTTDIANHVLTSECAGAAEASSNLHCLAAGRCSCCRTQCGSFHRHAGRSGADVTGPASQICDITNDMNSNQKQGVDRLQQMTYVCPVIHSFRPQA
jgi:hypothetical protein